MCHSWHELQSYAGAWLGIEERVHPHTLRRSFATDLLREVHNVEIVRRALGYARLTTTQAYVHLVDEDLEEALKSFRRPEAVTA